LIADSIRRIANEGRPTFAYGHCNNINVLCKDAKVLTREGDLPQRKANEFDINWYVNLSDIPIPLRPIP